MDEKKIKQLFLAKRLILVTIILYIAVFFAMNSPFLTFDNVRRVFFSFSKAISEKQDYPGKTLSFTEDKKNCFGIYKDGLVILSQKSLTVYDKDFYEISSYNVNLREPVLKISDDYIICFDRGSTVLYVADSFNILHSMTFNDNIINVTVGDNGYLAVITDSFGYKGMVTVLNKDFETIYKWSSSSHYLIDSVFSSNDIISVISVISEKENLNTVVYRINYNNGKELNEYVAEDRFPISVNKKNDNSIEIVTDNDIISIRGDGYNVLYKYGQMPVNSFMQDERNTIISKVADATSRQFVVEAINSVGNLRFTKNFIDVKSISCFYDVYLVLAENNLYVLDNTGNVVYSEEVTSGANKVIANRNIALVIGSNFAEKVNIFSALT
jgi:hypothetical protein